METKTASSLEGTAQTCVGASADCHTTSE